MGVEERELKIFRRCVISFEKVGDVTDDSRRRQRISSCKCRVGCARARARCVRILFTDGYEIDILGDPTREAHGTNKRHGTAESFVQISSMRFVAGFCFDVKCEIDLPLACLRNYLYAVRWVALIIFNANCFCESSLSIIIIL